MRHRGWLRRLAVGHGSGRQATAASAGEITCQELVELVTTYLDGAFSPADNQRFEVHLEGCPHCRVYLEQMRQTVAAVGGLAERDLDPIMRDRLLEAFRMWKPPSGASG